MRHVGLIEKMKFDVATGCWNWTGAKLPKGYGVKLYNGKLDLVQEKLIASEAMN